MAYVVSKPSRAYNLTYLAFGYVASSLLIHRFYDLSIQDTLLVSTMVGSFFGAFCFYMKPELLPYKAKLFFSLFDSGDRYILSSPYLTQTLAYASGAFYFTISAILGCYTLPVIRSMSSTVQQILLAAATLPISTYIYEMMLLRTKISTVRKYYKLLRVTRSQLVDVDDYTTLRQQVQAIRHSLERGDWSEADAMLRAAQSFVKEMK
jgi:hypothetical protein